jgi:uncharacterized phage protein (TIGR02220 family)
MKACTNSITIHHKNGNGGVRMSMLLIQDRPLMVLPKLAAKIGMNEAIVLQQVHYWLTLSKNLFEGRNWVFNTYEEWLLQFPFWSLSTMRRTMISLEKQGLLLSANWNKLKMDHTKWYTIDYERLQELEVIDLPTSVKQAPVQLEEEKMLVLTTEVLSESITVSESSAGSSLESSSEIPSTKKTKDIPYREIIDYLNEKTQSSYRVGTKKTKELIYARWVEGYTLEDFKQVIDIKTLEWMSDPYWSKFLRPETLFGTKFESYLNQKSRGKIYNEEDFDLND